MALNGILRCRLGYATFGIVIQAGRVVEVAPIVRRFGLVGLTVDEAARLLAAKGGQCTWHPDPPERETGHTEGS